jgi:hypothetical protein
MGVLRRGLTDGVARVRFRSDPPRPQEMAPRTAKDDSRLRTAATPRLPRVRSSDDADRPSARWKAPSLPDTACLGWAGDWVCPCRDCRGCDTGESRRLNHGQDGAGAVRSAESHDRVTRADSLLPIVPQCRFAKAIHGWSA